MGSYCAATFTKVRIYATVFQRDGSVRDRRGQTRLGEMRFAGDPPCGIP